MLSTLHPHFIYTVNTVLEKRFNEKLKTLEKMYILSRNGHSVCFSPKTLLYYLGPEKLNIVDYIKKNSTSKINVETVEERVDTLASNTFLKTINEKYVKRLKESTGLPDIRDLCLNKANKYEIAYNNNILDLFTLESRRRHVGDNFTVSLIKYFNLEFQGIPSYILRVFEKSQWEDVQMTLGRALVDYQNKPIIFFCGTASNSKSTLLNILGLSLNKLVTNISYHRYKAMLKNIKQRESQFGSLTLPPSVLFSFLGSRIIAIDDVNLDNLVKDAKNDNLFLNYVNHTLICCVEKKPTEEDIKTLERPCYVIEFPYKFTSKPEEKDERICLINKPAVSPMLSWLLLGAHQFLKREAKAKCDSIINSYKKHICEMCRDEDEEELRRSELAKILSNWP